MFQFPGFAPLRVHHIGVGCPIQKSSDQSLFAAPRRLSQRITSFIASSRQGIHQMPLRHLITLISYNHKTTIRRMQHLTKPTKAKLDFNLAVHRLLNVQSMTHTSYVSKTYACICLDQFMRHNWRGSGQAPPWTQSSRIMLTG